MATPSPGLTPILHFPALSERAAGTYNANAYNCLNAWANTSGPELSSIANNVYSNSQEAYNSALTATAQATIATSAAGTMNAIAWVSGTTYTIGAARYSPTDLQTYRRLTNGAGTTDPISDATNWVRVITVSSAVSARSSNSILVSSDLSKIIYASGTWTQTLTSAASLGSGWYCYIRNVANGDITIDPNGTELIDNASTYVLKPGYTIMLACTGSGFIVLEVVKRTYSNISQYSSSNTLTVPPGCYVMRAYALGKGGDATSGVAGPSGGAGGCAYGDIAVTPGQTVTLTISSGIATVVYGGVTLLTANPASGATAGTASKHASVTNGGAYSGGTGQGSGLFGGASSGSPLGAGVNGSGYGGSGWGGSGFSGNGGGGGVGGSGSSGKGGDGLSVPSTDPLLFGLNAVGGAYLNASSRVQPAQPGAGGGDSNGGTGGTGGFGAGGGASTPSGGAGGPGGFGGGGGGGFVAGGPGGFGGGGGAGGTTAGTGGGAVIRIYY